MAWNEDTGATGGQTVTALFESGAEADKARADLVAAGFTPADIMTSSGADHAATAASKPSQSILKSILDIFIFMPPHEAPTYEEALRRGGVAVAVRTQASSYEKAIDILDRDGALDLDERETLWKSQGWSPDASAARPGGPGSSEQAGFESANRHDPLINSDATADVRERIGTGTADMTVGTDLNPPSAVGGTPTIVRDLSHGRTRVRSYTDAAADLPSGVDPQI